MHACLLPPCERPTPEMQNCPFVGVGVGAGNAPYPTYIPSPRTQQLPAPFTHTQFGPRGQAVRGLGASHPCSLGLGMGCMCVEPSKAEKSQKSLKCVLLRPWHTPGSATPLPFGTSVGASTHTEWGSTAAASWSGKWRGAGGSVVCVRTRHATPQQGAAPLAAEEACCKPGWWGCSTSMAE